MKHTPGPWQLNKTAYCSGRIGIGQIDSKIDVAEACWFNGDHNQTLANAQLIAAAPRLYDFLKQIADSGNAEALSLLEAIDGNT